MLDETKFNDVSVSEAGKLPSSYIYKIPFKTACNFVSALYPEERDRLCEILYIDKNSKTKIEDIADALTDNELVKLGCVIPDSEDEHNMDYSELDYLTLEDILDNECLDCLLDTEYNLAKLITVDEDGYLCLAFDNEYILNTIKDELDPSLIADFKIEEGTNVIHILPVDFTLIDNQKVSEEVVINSELNPAIFDKDTHKMHPDVRESLLEYVQDFKDYINRQNIYLPEPADVILIGSNAGYLYTDQSDVDIHLICEDAKYDPETFAELRNYIQYYTTENPLYVDDTYRVELNVEDGFNMSSNSARKYSIINDDWVGDSDKEEVYTQADLEKVAGYEESVQEYHNRIDDVVDNNEYADAVELKAEIRKNRSDDLINYGSLSMGNVVFKELRNDGYFGKLLTYIKDYEENNSPFREE